MEILFTIIGLSVVIVVHEFGHFLAAKICGVKVHEFNLGFPPKLFSFYFKGTLYKVNLLPLGGYVKLEGEDDVSENASASGLVRDSFAAQTTFKKIFILCAGVAMNVLLGFIVMCVVYSSGIKEQVVVARVSEESPAAVAGIKDGDTIRALQFGTEPVIEPMQVADVITFVSKTRGSEFKLTVERGEEVLTFALVGREDPPPGQGALGVSLVKVGFAAQPFPASLFISIKETAGILREIVVQFALLIKNAFVAPSALEQVTGPVGIFQIAIQTSSLGFLYFIHFLGFISLNLAVFNLIPFPALDGGRVIFALFEKFLGARFSRRFQVAAHVVGFSLLILLMIVVTIRDVSRFF